MSQGDPLDDELYGAGLPLPTPGRPGEPLAAWSDPGPTRDGDHDSQGFCIHEMIGKWNCAIVTLNQEGYVIYVFV